ncbi:MAG: SHOCT domain-containing protein [Rhizomicrobium sp.]
MPASALYTVAMSPADAFDYTREALRDSGVTLGLQTPPAQIEFSLTRKDLETGSIEAVMPGRAVIAPSLEPGKSNVTIAVDPATQFIVYAVALGLAALLFGGFFFGGGLWFLLVIGAEGYLFWSIFSKWPSDALNAIRARMQASSAVSGGTPVIQPAVAPIFGPNAGLQPAKTGAAEIAEEIRHLAELRDQGHITQAEFDAKKTELLKRI